MFALCLRAFCCCLRVGACGSDQSFVIVTLFFGAQSVALISFLLLLRLAMSWHRRVFLNLGLRAVRRTLFDGKLT
jgi:hypothetical protein